MHAELTTTRRVSPTFALFGRRLPPGAWVAYAACIWSLAYGGLGLFWALGGDGFPFGTNDPGADDGLSLFAGLEPGIGGSAIAGLGLAGALVGFAMALPEKRGFFPSGLLTFASIACAVLVFVVPDVRVLQNLAYGVMLRFDRLDWPVVNQFLCIGGGLLWGATAVVYGRRITGGCLVCGRTDGRDGWTTPAAAARWGRWATWIAAIAPLPYGIVRWAWFLGIPLGVSEEFVVELNQDIAAKGAEQYKFLFGSETIVGAILTLGLIQRWGEVSPRWMPFLAGRRVPIWLAVVPASLVAIVATVAGRVIVGSIVLDGDFDVVNWGLAGPALLWPVWGAALGAATLAYYFRRRGPCGACGRGELVSSPANQLAASARPAAGGWMLDPIAGPNRAVSGATSKSTPARTRQIVLVAVAALSGIAAGLVAMLGVAVATARPTRFLVAGLAVFCVVYLLLLLRATRDIAPARRQRLRALLFGVGTVAVVGVFAATALPPLDDPRLLPAPVSGQQFWHLPTGSSIAYVRVAAAGHPHPTPVIFLHGGPGVPDMAGDSRYFGGLARDGFDVYVYDQVGTGRSTRLDDPRDYTLERDVADLEEIRRAIGAERMVLIGHSNGGMIAAAYAAAHGQHVAAMVLSSPGDPSPSAGGMSMRGRLSTKDKLRLYALLLHPRPLLAYALLQVNPNASQAFASDEELDARQDRVYNRTRPALHCRGKPPGPELHGLGFFDNQYPQSAASPPHADFLPDLAERTIPTLVIKGRCDYLSWSSAVAYLKTLPNARLMYFEGSGHNAYQDEPERYMAAVQAFLLERPLPELPYEGWHMPDGYEGPP